MKAPPLLKFLDLSKNNLTQLPKLKLNQNITLDVRYKANSLNHFKLNRNL